MADWGHGYTTSSSYTFGFYREIAPSYLRLICLLQGIVPPQGRLTCLELGCGQGLGPLLLGASNPDHTFVGVDFHPEHIARARADVATYGLENVSYLEADFESLAANPDRLPECDVITLHGIYSWVGEGSKEAIRTIIKERLKPGGVVYVSYNCAAGWGPSMQLQKLIYELSSARGGTLRQTSETVKRLKSMSEHQLFDHLPAVKGRLDTLATKDPNYVLHEYLNRHWKALHSVDVAREMSSCKLTFVGSAHPVDNLTELSLPPEILPMLSEEIDLGLLELIKDTFIAKPFRADVFIRGAVRLSVRSWLDAMAKQSFALLKPKSAVTLEYLIPRGKIQLGKTFYPQVLAMLDAGPGTLSELKLRPKDLKDAISFLIALRAIHPAQTGTRESHRAHAINLANVQSTDVLVRQRVFATPLLGTAHDIEPSAAPAFAAALRGETVDQAKLEMLRSDPQYAGFYKKEGGGEVTLDALTEQMPGYLGIWKQLGLLP